MGIINVRGVSYKCCMFDMTEEDVVNIHNHLESELRLDNFIRLDNKNICHYWFFKDKHFDLEKPICNACHDISMVCYRYILWNMTYDKAFDLLNNTKLNERGSL